MDREPDTSAEETINNDLEARVMEAGVIEQVYVQDFMCHKKLTVDLGR